MAGRGAYGTEAMSRTVRWPAARLLSLNVPLDAEGFALASAASDAGAISDSMQRFGFAVVRGHLPPAACAATVDDCWQQLESESWRPPNEPRVGGVRRHDAATWSEQHGWPGGMGQTEGIIGERVTFTRRSLLNRMSPDLHVVFAALLGEQDLIVSHDRYGFFRPAAGQPERASDRNLHFDFNPWTLYGIPVDTSAARVSAQDRHTAGEAYADDGDFIREGNYAGSLLRPMSVSASTPRTESRAGYMPGICLRFYYW